MLLLVFFFCCFYCGFTYSCFFWVVWLVSRFQYTAGLFNFIFGGGDVSVIDCCLLLTRPAELPSSLHYHHHLLVFVNNNGLKTLFIQANFEYVVTMYCPVSRPHRYDLFHTAIPTSSLSCTGTSHMVTNSSSLVLRL